MIRYGMIRHSMIRHRKGTALQKNSAAATLRATAIPLHRKGPLPPSVYQLVWTGTRTARPSTRSLMFLQHVEKFFEQPAHLFRISLLQHLLTNFTPVPTVALIHEFFSV
jgi:hypothetical protein